MAWPAIIMLWLFRYLYHYLSLTDTFFHALPANNLKVHEWEIKSKRSQKFNSIKKKG